MREGLPGLGIEGEYERRTSTSTFMKMTMYRSMENNVK
jgi:hypothetical protein